jgi:hypothetical protein
LKILLWHRLTCLKQQPWPGADAEVAPSLKKNLDGYGLVITGDNHQQFADSWLVNP